MMTKTEIRQAIKRNGLSVKQFAALIGRDANTVYGYGDRLAVPRYAAFVLTLLDTSTVPRSWASDYADKIIERK